MLLLPILVLLAMSSAFLLAHLTRTVRQVLCFIVIEEIFDNAQRMAHVVCLC
jgi:hypothetical protein